MSFKSFNWLRDGLLPLSIAIMIVCWVSPWMLWIKTWPLLGYQHAILSPISMAAILIASTFITKLFLRQDWPLERVQALISGLGFVAILLFIGREYYSSYFLLDPRWLGDLFWALSDIFNTGIPAQLIGILLGAYLWWRGIALGRESVEFDDVFKAFRTGIIALISLLVLSISIIDTEGFKAIQEQGVTAVLAFFFFSLLSLSLSRLEQVRDEAKRREGKALGFNRDWLVAVIASIVGIVFLGFVVSSIFSFDLAARLLSLLLRAADLLMIPLYFVLLAIGYVAEVVIYIFQFLLWLLRIAPNPQKPEPPPSLFDEDKMRQNTEAKIPPEIVQAIEWAMVAAIIALAIFIFVKAITRLRRQQTEDDVEEIHESLWSWQMFMDGVRDWLRSLWLRLVGQRGRPAIRAMADRFQSDPEYRVSLSIRHIYQSLLAFAARLGIPKGLDETPYEYLRVLEGTLPAGREDLLAITEAYVTVRYGGQPAQAREFQVVDQAWSRVRAMLSSLEAEKRKGEKEK